MELDITPIFKMLSDVRVDVQEVRDLVINNNKQVVLLNDQVGALTIIIRDENGQGLLYQARAHEKEIVGLKQTIADHELAMTSQGLVIDRLQVQRRIDKKKAVCDRLWAVVVPIACTVGGALFLWLGQVFWTWVVGRG